MKEWQDHIPNLIRMESIVLLGGGSWSVKGVPSRLTASPLRLIPSGDLLVCQRRAPRSRSRTMAPIHGTPLVEYQETFIPYTTRVLQLDLEGIKTERDDSVEVHLQSSHIIVFEDTVSNHRLVFIRENKTRLRIVKLY